MIKVDLRPKPFTFGKLLRAIQRIVSPVLLIGASVFALGLYLLSPFTKGDPFPQFGWGIVLGYILGIAVRRLGRWANDNGEVSTVSCVGDDFLLVICALAMTVPIHFIRASATVNWWPFGACYYGVALLAFIVGDPFLSRLPRRSLITVCDDDGTGDNDDPPVPPPVPDHPHYEGN